MDEIYKNAREWEKRKKEYLELGETILPGHLCAVGHILKEQAEKTDNEVGPHDVLYREIFLTVYAPVLVSYVRWILKNTPHTVYFLSRDGWLMKHAAEILLDGDKEGARLRYLKVSRYSLRRAEYFLNGKKCLDTICTGGLQVTFRKLMKRGGLTEEETLRIGGLAGIGENRMDEPLSFAQIREIKKTLGQIDIFFEYIREHSEECYQNTMGYLRQEGLTEDTPFAIADSGWLGTTMRSLKALTKASFDGYFFGLYELPAERDSSRCHGFFIDPGQRLIDRIKRKTAFCICLFETICSSPEGMTLGYRFHPDEKRFVPADSIVRNPNAEKMVQNKVLLERYIMALKDSGALERKYAENTTKAIYRLLKRSMGEPTVFEANILGKMLFCDDLLEDFFWPVARVWSSDEIRRQRFFHKTGIKLGFLTEKLQESGWPEGSLVNAGRSRQLSEEHLFQLLMNIRKEKFL